MTDSILKDTSLCAIVRDEMMNPAGGIESFVRSTVPFVEQAVVFDTGSIDGTREKLEDLTSEFPQMKVYDRPFDNYINARNASLEKVETKWTLILDADELITQSGFSDLRPILESCPAEVLGHNFQMEIVFPFEKNLVTFAALHNPRLFLGRDSIRYSRIHYADYCEFLFDFGIASSPIRLEKTGMCRDLDESIRIYHFVPSEYGMILKNNEWYGAGFSSGSDCKKSPSQCFGFNKWKRLSPKRYLYK